MVESSKTQMNFGIGSCVYRRDRSWGKGVTRRLDL